MVVFLSSFFHPLEKNVDARNSFLFLYISKKREGGVHKERIGYDRHVRV
jgi:hypothetical protein